MNLNFLEWYALVDLNSTVWDPVSPAYIIPPAILSATHKQILCETCPKCAILGDERSSLLM